MQVFQYICIVCVYVAYVLLLTCLHTHARARTHTHTRIINVSFFSLTITILAVMNDCLGNEMTTGKSVFISYFNKTLALNFQNKKEKYCIFCILRILSTHKYK